ncbi:unnamed protein product [Vitrella brassicaformis CCMP3155]|uniref:RING-type domain-containing protein n=1 Tax=Vitrella brassicaformis (strain CCMP3155) TaxID=1169540 RepID=A0A0G4EX49_VITBC|nr:unnamed protein product [Vitrella brassicaformis CCMP3155]|eukprot:CEM03368.1 unnamed protein product [Vitrella brassicaformis CCMP3155]
MALLGQHDGVLMEAMLADSQAWTIPALRHVLKRLVDLAYPFRWTTADLKRRTTGFERVRSSLADREAGGALAEEGRGLLYEIEVAIFQVLHAAMTSGALDEPAAYRNYVLAHHRSLISRARALGIDESGQDQDLAVAAQKFLRALSSSSPPAGQQDAADNATNETTSTLPQEPEAFPSKGFLSAVCVVLLSVLLFPYPRSMCKSPEDQLPLSIDAQIRDRDAKILTLELVKRNASIKEKELRKEIRTLTDLLFHEKGRLSDQSAEQSKRTALVRDLETRIEAMSGSPVEERKQIEESNAKIETLEAEARKTVLQEKQLRNENKTLRQSVRGYQDTLGRSRSKEEQLRGEIKALKDKATLQEVPNREREQQLAMWEEQLNEKGKALSDKEGELATKTTVTPEDRKRMESMCWTLAEKDMELALLRSCNEQQVKSLQRQEREVGELTRRLKDANSRLQQKTIDHRSVSRERDQQAGQIAELMDQQNWLLENMKVVDCARQQLETHKQQLEADIRGLRGELQQSQLRLKHLTMRDDVDVGRLTEFAGMTEDDLAARPIISLINAQDDARKAKDIHEKRLDGMRSLWDKLQTASMLAAVRAQTNTEECSICMSATKTKTFIPCGHFVSCDKCASQVFRRPGRLYPICRRQIQRLQDTHSV